MDAIFMNSENNKTSKQNVLVLKLTDELDLIHTTAINLKYQHPHGKMNLNYLMDRILYQIFKIILSIF